MANVGQQTRCWAGHTAQQLGVSEGSLSVLSVCQAIGIAFRGRPCFQGRRRQMRGVLHTQVHIRHPLPQAQTTRLHRRNTPAWVAVWRDWDCCLRQGGQRGWTRWVDSVAPKQSPSPACPTGISCRCAPNNRCLITAAVIERQVGSAQTAKGKELRPAIRANSAPVHWSC